MKHDVVALRIETFSQETIFLLNKIFSRCDQLFFMLGDHPCRVVLPAHNHLLQEEVYLKLSIERSAVLMGLGPCFPPRWTETLYDWETFSEMPEKTRGILIEAALEDLFDRFETWSGLRVEVRQVLFREQVFNETRKPTGIPRGPVKLDFEFVPESGGITNENQTIMGRLHLEMDASQWIDPLLEHIPRTVGMACDGIPLRLVLLVGRTRLTLSGLREIEPGDVILLDEHAPSGDGSVEICLAPRLSFQAHLNGRTVTVRRLVRGFMEKDHFDEIAESDDDLEDQDFEKIEDSDEVPAAEINDIMIGLTFEVGRKTISLGELMHLHPGYTFELENPLDKPVAIRANGKRIGWGELVGVANRIGVRVLTFLKNNDERAS
ncbi:hypothetical protein TRIP_B200791 [uncultured Desulfatiglans sp.]|nr:hypothetical protein TRIP_B200791 [uncultured Desulfatiglans sp.]